MILTIQLFHSYLRRGVDGPVPDIAVTPPTIDFGEVAQGATGTKYFRIRNTGSGVLEIKCDEGSGDFTSSPT